MDSRYYATEIVKKLKDAGYIAYFAGGWVRDYLMNHPSSDIDIATNAPPEIILDLFPHTILVGLAFGVVIVVIEGHQFEVSSFRRDISYLNGRKPERIEFSTPEEDASRRDFTINGMFYDPLKDAIYDYVHGLEDLKKGIIRTIGDPQERFMEDRLRMIRAIRFACRFGFIIDIETQEGIIENADTLFPAVAMERIWQEFNKMANYLRFEVALDEMHRFGLLPVIFPKLQHVHLKDIKHRVSAFPFFPPNTPTILYLMDLFPNDSLEELIETCQYLRISNRDIKLVEFMFLAKKIIEAEENKDSSLTEADWARFFSNPDSNICLEVIAAHYTVEKRSLFLQNHQIRKFRLSKHIERILNQKPLVSALYLKNHGIMPGKNMGILLKEAETIAINHDLESQEAVLKLLKVSPNWPIKDQR